MEKVIKLSLEDGSVVISEDVLSTLKNLFSGCRVNFLLGAGFSANLLGTLSNNEVIFEALQKYQAKNEDERKKLRYYPLIYTGHFLLGVLNRFPLRYQHMIPHLPPIKNLEILCIGFFLKEAIRCKIGSSTSLQQL